MNIPPAAAYILPEPTCKFRSLFHVRCLSVFSRIRALIRDCLLITSGFWLHKTKHRDKLQEL